MAEPVDERRGAPPPPQPYVPQPEQPGPTFRYIRPEFFGLKSWTDLIANNPGALNTLQRMDAMWPSRFTNRQSRTRYAALVFEIQQMNRATQTTTVTGESSHPVRGEPDTGPIKPPDPREEIGNGTAIVEPPIAPPADPLAGLTPEQRTTYDQFTNRTPYVPPPVAPEPAPGSIPSDNALPPQPTGFYGSFIFQGRIYAVSPQGQVMEYSPQNKTWTQYQGNSNTIRQVWQRAHPPAEQAPVVQTHQPDFSTAPADVGVGNMRWNGAGFVGYNNAPVNPILLSTYAKQLRAAGWTVNGTQYTPPTNFGATNTGTNSGAGAKNAFGYVPKPSGGARTVTS